MTDVSFSEEEAMFLSVSQKAIASNTSSEKFFAWAAQVGGIAGLIHSLFLGLSALDVGSFCTKRSKEDEKAKNNSKDASSEGVELVL